MSKAGRARRVWGWSRRNLDIVTGGALLSLLALTVGWSVYSHRIHFPKTWDPAIAPLAARTEELRGLRFKHPVEVRSVPSDQFDREPFVRSGWSHSDEASSSATFRCALFPGSSNLPPCKLGADQQDVDPAASTMRALGISPADAKLPQLPLSIQGSMVVARYDPAKKVIEIRGSIAAVPRYVLVHELTHVLQDQHFGLKFSDRSLDEFLAGRAVIEGDAVRVERAFLDRVPLTASEAGKDEALGRDVALRFQREVKVAAVDRSATDLLVDISRFPYDEGFDYVTSLHERGGQELVDAALQRHPEDTATIMRAGAAVGLPQRVDRGLPPEQPHYNRRPVPLGAFYWREALWAGDRWDDVGALTQALAADWMYVYVSSGSAVCIRDRMLLTGPTATRAKAAVTALIAEREGEVTADGPYLTVTACDPRRPVAPEDLYSYPTVTDPITP